MSDMIRALERMFFSENKDIEGNFYRKESLEEEILFDGQERLSEIQEQFSWYPGHSLDLAKVTSALAIRCSDVFRAMDMIISFSDPEKDQALEVCGKTLLRIVREEKEFGYGNLEKDISEIEEYMGRNPLEVLSDAISLAKGEIAVEN